MDKVISWIYISSGANESDAVFHSLKQLENFRLYSQSTNWTSAQSLLSKFHPDFALIDLTDGKESLKWLGKWSAMFPQTIFLCSAASAEAELIVQAMRNGAHEFLLPQMSGDELQNAVLAAQRRLKGGEHQAQAKVICCYGVKGGVGTTTLATNLAVHVAKEYHKRVLLLDLKLHLGNAALFLDLKPRISLLDLYENISALDPATLPNTLTRHSSGVVFISGPENLEQADTITASAVGQIIELLRSEFDYIFIDSDSHFSEVTIRALDESDTILTIAQLDVATVYNLRRALALFQRLQYDQDKVAVILNRYPQRMTDDLEVIEKSIATPILCRLPLQENGVMTESVNTGEPLILTRPQNRFSQQVVQLHQLLRGDSEALAESTKALKSGFLKRWGR